MYQVYLFKMKNKRVTALAVTLRNLENLKEKEDSLKKNKYRKITFDFLEELKNSSDKDKLENLLPVYINELIKGGLFLK